ncbi:MAG TPA: AAA family ATPase [Candidatus Limnocylindrales bacterium]|nr:AAA family ATPase [Candidatus Limnocylindrales bacterium]
MDPGRLLERERELRVLDRGIASTLSGRAGVVLIEGPAGIGKSRLVAEARRRAAQHGLLVLSARGSELERDFPFGVVRQLFEPRLVDQRVRERVLAGAAVAAGSIFGLSGPDAGHVSGDSTFAALHALYWVTANLSAETPLLLAVDDLHWCDRTSLRFLGYLTRRLEGLPVLVVAGLRSAEPGVDVALLAELTGDPDAQHIVPRPLSADATAELVRKRLGDGVEAAFAEACHASTHGNPLLLGELLKTLESERVLPDAAHVGVVAELGPRAVSRAVLLRLARLSPGAVSAARALAVLGDDAETSLVGALAGLDGEAVADAGRELVRAEIVRREPPLGFVHPLVQAAIYRDLAPGERELTHERAARLLLERDAPAERIAAHLLAIPRQGESWVVDVLRAATRAAFAKGAPDAAIASLRRALHEPLPPELRAEMLFELGKAQSLMSLPDAADALRRAYEGARDPALRGHAADWLACTLTFLDELEEAAEIVRRTRLELPPELADLGRELEAGELISVFFGSRGDDEDRLARLRGHRTIDTRLGPGAKMLAAVAAWEWAESAGPASDVVALARAALEDNTIVSADAGELVVGAIVPLALADLDEAVAQWDAVRAEAHRSGFIFTMLAVQLWGGYTQYLRGELADAEAELRAALATAALWGVPTQQPWATAVLAELLVDRGALAEARALLDAATQPRPGSDPAMLLDRARLRVLLAEGRAEDALEHADVFQGHVGWRRHPRYAPWRSLKAQALDRLGRQDEAIELAAEELEIARGWGSPGTVGRSLRVLGTIERDDGLDHLEAACALLEHAPARLERAKALAALGGALRRARRPTDAREPLRKALELAEIAGATALVERTRAEIYATGARPRTAALHGVAALTASERRVADLAADGLSNRDIAQSLYVTPKTVEVHLSSAYRKLGVGSRRGLPHALARSG